MSMQSRQRGILDSKWLTRFNVSRLRCGALHVGDILLSVCGQPVGRCTVDEVVS